MNTCTIVFRYLDGRQDRTTATISASDLYTSEKFTCGNGDVFVPESIDGDTVVLRQTGHDPASVTAYQNGERA